jgi:hypothetical protein
MENTENNQDGESVWISSADKKYVLTFDDKALLENLLNVYCRDISFEKNFGKAFEKGYKYMENVFADLQQVYIDCLHGIISEFEETLAACTNKLFNPEGFVDSDIIDRHSQVFRVRQYKLTYTQHKYLELLLKSTVSNSDSSMQNFQDKQAEEYSKMLSQMENMKKPANIELILNDLVREVKVKLVTKKIPDIRSSTVEKFKSYVINTTYKKLREFIEKKVSKGIYNITDVDEFIITYIKNENFGSLRPAYYMYKKRSNNI